MPSKRSTRAETTSCGYGKSVCYQALPLLFDFELNNGGDVATCSTSAYLDKTKLLNGVVRQGEDTVICIV